MFNWMLHEVYITGYKGYKYPRAVRAFFAKTELHRAWVAGIMGIYTQEDCNGNIVRRSITGKYYAVC